MKAVIVAAGYGTRMLPFTKTVPKELAPLVDTPAISFVIAELREAGVNEILLISSRRKKPLDDYFDREIELESALRLKDRRDLLEKIRVPDVRISVTRQLEMLGTGHALLLAESFSAGDPVIVAYPDDLFFGSANPSRDLLGVYKETGASSLLVKDLGMRDVSRYGVIDAEPHSIGYRVKRIVEKPPSGSEPSRLVCYGRYLLTPDIFPILNRGWNKHEVGEFYHIGALNELARLGKLFAVETASLRLDLGEPAGYLEAFCRYALLRDDLREHARSIFQSLASDS